MANNGVHATAYTLRVPAAHDAGRSTKNNTSRQCQLN